MFKNKTNTFYKKDFIKSIAFYNHINMKDSEKVYKMFCNTFNNILKNFQIGDKLILPKVLVIEAKLPRKVANNVPKKTIRYYCRLLFNEKER